MHVVYYSVLVWMGQLIVVLAVRSNPSSRLRNVRMHARWAVRVHACISKATSCTENLIKSVLKKKLIQSEKLIERDRSSGLMYSMIEL